MNRRHVLGQGHIVLPLLHFTNAHISEITATLKSKLRLAVSVEDLEGTSGLAFKAFYFNISSKEGDTLDSFLMRITNANVMASYEHRNGMLLIKSKEFSSLKHNPMSVELDGFSARGGTGSFANQLSEKLPDTTVIWSALDTERDVNIDIALNGKLSLNDVFKELYRRNRVCWNLEFIPETGSAIPKYRLILKLERMPN